MPGDRLNQDDIAARLNVSRQPVNSAISILKANGFVRDTGKRGSVVTELEPAQLHDVYEFRTAIEPDPFGLGKHPSRCFEIGKDRDDARRVA